MKQHIFLEQLNELSDKGKEKLREWWEPREGDVYTRKNELTERWVVFEDGSTDHAEYPLLSIGQMIEFLDSYSNEENSYLMKYWSISKDTYSTKDEKIYWNDPINHLGYKELCDALWEACKCILENDIYKTSVGDTWDGL